MKPSCRARRSIRTGGNHEKPGRRLFLRRRALPANEPMFVNCCHCKDCQRQTGSAFVINAIIETDRIETFRRTVPVPMPTDSGRPHDIYRCPKCQIALWSDYGRRPADPFRARGHAGRTVAACRPTCTFSRARNCPGSAAQRCAGLRDLLRHEDAVARRKPRAPQGYSRRPLRPFTALWSA